MNIDITFTCLHTRCSPYPDGLDEVDVELAVFGIAPGPDVDGAEPAEFGLGGVCLAGGRGGTGARTARSRGSMGGAGWQFNRNIFGLVLAEKSLLGLRNEIHYNRKNCIQCKPFKWYTFVSQET